MKFPDGTTAYTLAAAGASQVYGLENHIYNGEKELFEKEYIYTEAPEIVFAKERKAKEISHKASVLAKAKWKAKGGVRIGMTKAQALASNWGRPNSINKTTTASGTHEQWVYGGGNYLYFENGELTSIQN